MESFQLLNVPISAHAFNGDRTQLACCPNNNQVHIYVRQGSDWQLRHVLSDHGQLVTSIDWAPRTNRLVTASQDRNAYVWSYDQPTDKWKPTLVLLRINRAATHVRWSPLENKFAVASGARLISVCYFDEANDWWVSKHLKKPIRSTVLSLDWHPNNVLLAAGASDMKARVFSAYIKGVDQKPPPSPWGERLPFNTVCAEYTNGTGGWVHSVAFSPDGTELAWVGHDSSVTIASPAQNSVYVVKSFSLPFASLLWLTANSIVATGHDCMPILFSRNDRGEWQFVEKLDLAGKAKKSSGGLAGNAAFNKFKQMDTRASSSEEVNNTDLATVHQNTITSVRPFAGPREAIAKFSTSGVDGRVVLWDVRNLETIINGLRIV